MPHQFHRDGTVSVGIRLNWRPTADINRTVAVTGTPRGGTTMVAVVLEALGIDMGRREDLDKFHYEDQTMLTTDGVIKSRYIRRFRNKRFHLWGWKNPSSIGPSLGFLSLLRNLHVIIVARDFAATVEGELRFDRVNNVEGRTVGDVLNAWLNWTRSNIDFCIRTNLPTLLLSYERCMSSPTLCVDEIIAFLGIPVSQEQRDEALSRISRDGYLMPSGWVGNENIQSTE